MMKLCDYGNNFRILTLSFCIWDFDTYNTTEVRNVDEMFKNEVFMKELEEKAPKTELVILANHIGNENQQNYEIIKHIRDYFENNLNYTVPIILLTAHTNQLVKKECEFTVKNEDGTSEVIKVENCYNTESGYYG